MRAGFGDQPLNANMPTLSTGKLNMFVWSFGFYLKVGDDELEANPPYVTSRDTRFKFMHEVGVKTDYILKDSPVLE